MNKKYITGVGPRKNVPDYILDAMRKCGMNAYEMGYSLRSGAAPGSDSAFEEGFTASNKKLSHEKMEIILPHPYFQKRKGEGYYNVKEQSGYEKAAAEAEIIHPGWLRCSGFAKLAHTRNMMQVMGLDMSTPTELVVLYGKYIGWGKNRRLPGGTNSAFQVAVKNKIPVYNLYYPDDMDAIIDLGFIK